MFENTCTPNPLIKVIPVGYDHCMIKMESRKQAKLIRRSSQNGDQCFISRFKTQHF